MGDWFHAHRNSMMHRAVDSRAAKCRVKQQGHNMPHEVLVSRSFSVRFVRLLVVHASTSSAVHPRLKPRHKPRIRTESTMPWSSGPLRITHDSHAEFQTLTPRLFATKTPYKFYYGANSLLGAIQSSSRTMALVMYTRTLGIVRSRGEKDMRN